MYVHVYTSIPSKYLKLCLDVINATHIQLRHVH